MNVIKQNRPNKLGKIDFKKHLPWKLDDIKKASLINKNISLLPKEKRNMIYLPKKNSKKHESCL
jgi:ribosomal protein L33